MQKIVVMDSNDNVGVAISDFSPGESVAIRSTSITIRERVLFGHKIALETIRTGENIVKYGCVIGKATKKIEVGQHVHIHNVESFRGRGDLQNV